MNTADGRRSQAGRSTSYHPDIEILPGKLYHIGFAADRPIEESYGKLVSIFSSTGRQASRSSFAAPFNIMDFIEKVNRRMTLKQLFEKYSISDYDVVLNFINRPEAGHNIRFDHINAAQRLFTAVHICFHLHDYCILHDGGLAPLSSDNLFSILSKWCLRKNKTAILAYGKCANCELELRGEELSLWGYSDKYEQHTRRPINGR